MGASMYLIYCPQSTGTKDGYATTITDERHKKNV
jgi:hypothetical protein